MGLGMPEVILILVVALIIFGPRKLPELGKTLGQAMSQFRRASDDFKRTWEQEVELDKYRNNPTESSSNYDSSTADNNQTYNPYSGEYESTSSSDTSDASTAQSTETQPVNGMEPVTPANADSATAVATSSTEPKQQHWI